MNFMEQLLNKKKGVAPTAQKTLKQELKDLGPITKTEIKALIIFALTVFLWATDGKHIDMFGFQISLVMVALFASCLFFLVHIVTRYQLWSANPQMQDYVFALLGAMALMFFGFYEASQAADCGNPRY